MEQEQVNTKLDAVLAREVKAQAALQGRTLKDVLGEAASEWLAKARDEAKAREGEVA